MAAMMASQSSTASKLSSSPAPLSLLSAADLAASKQACLQLYLTSPVPSASTSTSSEQLEHLLHALKSSSRGAAALQNTILARKEDAERCSTRREIECVERIRRRWSRDVCARVEELSEKEVEGRRVDVSRWVGGAANGGTRVRLARRECRDETDEMAYTIPQLLGAIMSIRSPSSSSSSAHTFNGHFRPSHPRTSVPSWGSIPLDLRVPSRDELSAAMEDDMGPHAAQCGIDDDDTIHGIRVMCATPRNANDTSGHSFNGRKQQQSLASARAAGTSNSSSTTFLLSRLSRALAVRRSGRTTSAQKFLRRGSPHCEHRLPLWRLALGGGGDDPVAKKEREARFDELVRRVDDVEYVWIDQAVCGDVAKIADDGEYFIFAEQLRLLMLCFVRDEQLPRMCSTLPHPLIAVNSKKNHQAHYPQKAKTTPLSKSATDLPSISLTSEPPPKTSSSFSSSFSLTNTVTSPSRGASASSSWSSAATAAGSDAPSLVPPCGVLPFSGISNLAALVLYLTDDTCEAYFLFRALYARHAVHLHVISSSSGSESLLQLCAAFENMLQESEPRLFFHILHLGMQPLELCFEWIVRGFVGHLSAREALNLWDRIIGHGSLLVLPAAAAAILVFRKTAILSATSADVVREILSDICELKVIPLLQAFIS